jgi:hypothetical protein
MAKPVKTTGLEIHQDMEYQRLEWRIQRVSWALWALVLVAAALGLLGPGFLSSSSVGSSEDKLWARFDRFSRYQAPSTIRVHIGPGVGNDGKVRLAINRRFIEEIELNHIDPQPDSVEAGPDHYHYIFTVPGPDQPTAVSYHFRPISVGRIPIQIKSDEGQELNFTTFCYP